MPHGNLSAVITVRLAGQNGLPDYAWSTNPFAPLDGEELMLKTNLKHMEANEETQTLLKENDNVMICCGRMGPMCIPVYGVMEQLEGEYPHVAFRDMDFDIPAAAFIQNLPECASFMGLPFTVYFRKGQVVKATTSIQNREQITAILDAVFGKNG